MHQHIVSECSAGACISGMSTQGWDRQSATEALGKLYPRFAAGLSPHLEDEYTT